MSRFSSVPPSLSTKDFIEGADAPRPSLLQRAAEPAPSVQPMRSAPIVKAEPPTPPSAARVARPAQPKATKAPATEKPWEGHRRKAKPSKSFNLRVNEYELALLRFVVEQVSTEREEDVSMHQVCKEILISELERRAGIEPKGRAGENSDV